MKKRLSAFTRVLGAFFLASSISIGTFSTPVHASNTAQLDVATIIALANADRAANGASALTEDTLLDSAAQQKANDMANKGYFAHVSPDGTTPWDWFKAVGYYYYDAGENLAEGYSDSVSLEDAWMHSPTHRANLVNPIYKRVGIGIAEGTYQGRPTIFVAQEFANPYVAQSQALAQAPVQQTVAKAVSAPSVKKLATAAKKKVIKKHSATVATLPKRVSISSALATTK